MTKLDLDNQYAAFLQRMALDESTMPEVQRTETKRAFYAGFGQMLIVLMEEMDFGKNPQTFVYTQYMVAQIRKFFEKEIESDTEELDEKKLLPPNIDENLNAMLVDISPDSDLSAVDKQKKVEKYVADHPGLLPKLRKDLVTGIKNGYSIEAQLEILKFLKI